MSRLSSSRNVQNLLSLLRKAAQQARESLQDIADAIPRHLNPKPALVRVPVDARRPMKNRFAQQRFSRACGANFSARHLGCRFFSSRPCTINALSTAVYPAAFRDFSKCVIARNLTSASWTSAYRKSKPLVLRHLDQAPNQFHLAHHKALIFRNGFRSIHTLRATTASQAVGIIWDGEFARAKRGARPLAPPQFYFPPPSLSRVLGARAASTTSSIPSLSQLARAFHIQVPQTGSYVDFDLTPTITVPSVATLSEEVVDQLSDDLERFADELKKIAQDLRSVSRLGELPLSVEHGRALRVYFANSEPERVQSLLAEAEVTQGVVHGQSLSPILSPMEDFSDASGESFYASSLSSNMSSGGDEFHYFQESSSGSSTSTPGDYEIPHLRNIESSYGSYVSITTPSLTTASETISDGSSVLYA
jgi:hypothetical protein